MATSRTPLDWFRYQVGMRSFRAFAQGKATWILNYSWDGDANIAPPEPMMNLAMSVVMAGANFWDAATHVMSGSNDLPTRKRIFSWIEKNENTLYAPRSLSVRSACTSRHRRGTTFRTCSCAPTRALSSCCCRRICEFQIVTPRTLAAFRGSTLILPDVRAARRGRAQRPQRAGVQRRAARSSPARTRLVFPLLTRCGGFRSAPGAPTSPTSRRTF